MEQFAQVAVNGDPEMRNKTANVITRRDIEMKKDPESVRFKNTMEHINFYFKAL